MICPNCGNENKDDVNQCVFCGQRLASKNASANPQNSYQNQDPSQSNPYQNQGFYQGNPYQNQNTNQGDPYRNQNPYQDQNSYQGNPYQDQSSYNNPYGNQGSYQNNPYQNQNPYQNYGPNGPQNPKSTNSFALTSMILALASIIVGCLVTYLGIGMDIAAIVFGIIALKKYPGTSKGMAITGIVVGAIMLVMWILVTIMAFYLLSSGIYNDLLSEFNSMM